MGLGRLIATTPSDAWPFRPPGEVSVRNFISPFLAAPREFQPAGNCGPLTGAATVDRTVVATGFEAPARTVFSAGAGTVTEAETLTAFKGFAVVIVCELGATVFEGGAGIVTATGAEIVAELKCGTGALAGICTIREAGGRATEGAEVVGDFGPGNAADAGTVPGIVLITSSGTGIKTVAGTPLASGRVMTGLSTDLRCAITAASWRLLRRMRAIRAR